MRGSQMNRESRVLEQRQPLRATWVSEIPEPELPARATQNRRRAALCAAPERASAVEFVVCERGSCNQRLSQRAVADESLKPGAWPRKLLCSKKTIEVASKEPAFFRETWSLEDSPMARITRTVMSMAAERPSCCQGTRSFLETTCPRS